MVGYINNVRNFNAIRNGALNHFAYKPIPWKPGVGKQIFESELALQWGVVNYLEEKYRQKDPTKLKIINYLKESLFQKTEFLKHYKKYVDKSFYDLLVMQRQQLEYLLRPF